jgi:hypothetical protein
MSRSRKRVKNTRAGQVSDCCARERVLTRLRKSVMLWDERQRLVKSVMHRPALTAGAVKRICLGPARITHSVSIYLIFNY